MDDFLNPYRTRRGKFLTFKYWNITKDNMRTDKSTLTHEEKPQGSFDASFYNPETKSTIIVGQAFMFNTKDMTIASNDDLRDLNKNDIVECEEIPGQIWRVDSINTEIIRNNYEFCDVTLRYIISLTR